jgi:diketogulonate reductase-like aldo/keto reductase
MRYEIFHDIRIPKIGLGTFSIGGKYDPDPASDAWSLAALRSALELGYTLFDTAESYAGGHAEELVGQAIREMGIRREDLFITSKVSPFHLNFRDVLQSCENSLRRLEMDYLDLYLIHWPTGGMKLEETFRGLNQLVANGKIRHLGVSNFDLELLKQAAGLSQTPLLTDQVSYSMPDKRYVENGVLEFCQQNDILLTAYTPVKHRMTKSSSKLQAVARARGITPHQVALAWLATQPRVITIPMSANPIHQAENLRAGDLVLTTEEMDLLA